MTVCSNFAAGLTISDEEIENTEIATRGQSQNENWLQFRSGRVTASFFGEVNKNGILKLRENHNFYAQIQGGMGVKSWPWSDLAVYTY